ncbi:related to cell cycle checkpoint RAD17 [Lecanosticta acicola]|uniref:Related to cell cycle checkpoint RAD17 n=1 Tax=Lecanosticta acicola TaxID=111012 RepID=A0AAI9EDQ6_9PEZI|nr:related to cell cycle checkpoint RAD17 [Lecanosticta acicola]
MGPRVARRRAVTVLSDDEDNEVQAEDIQDETPKPQRRALGKLKSIKNGKASSSRASKTASPQKTSPKTKDKAQDAPKPAGKPIYSFFNAATQRQQATQPATSHDNALAQIEDDLEVIHDDSDDSKAQSGSTTALAKGSSTAVAMRKRKFQQSQSPGDQNGLPLIASQKFRKAGGGERVPSFTVKNEDNRPWTEQFAPIDLSELAVHKRKVGDVRNWLEMTYRGRRQKVLVLKGAAGVGKTMTIQLLAKQLGINLLEFNDPAPSDYATDGSGSASVRFEEFMARAGKNGGLQLLMGNSNNLAPANDSLAHTEDVSDDRLQALLVEEFPNTFSKTSTSLQAFRSALAQHVSSAVGANSKPTPVILVVSETLLSTNTAVADSFTAHRLLGPELMTNPYVDTIEFNAVAPTYLTKALETIVVKEARKSGRRRTPGPQVLKVLAETGDIRSAVSSLEFLCLRGDEGDIWSSKVSFTKSKQPKNQRLTKAEEEALKLVTNRESSLGIFHSVGKVVYNKRSEPPAGTLLTQPPVWLPQHQRWKVPETDTNLLIDEMGTDTPTFIAGLHENYALSCASPSAEESLDSLVGCMDSLSNSDLLSLDRFSFGTRAFSGSTTDSLRQDEMAFQVAVRGMLFSLPHPVHRSAAASSNRGDAHRMFYPTSLRIWRRREEVEGNLEAVISTLGSGSGPVTRKVPSSNENRRSGVESWQRNTAFESESSSTSTTASEAAVPHSTEVKNEMLMERLPYMAHILGSSKHVKPGTALLDQIKSITRVSGTNHGMDEDTDPEDAEEQGNAADQWATDRPDGELGVPGAGRKQQAISSKQKSAFEASSLPVETSVEKLVLEDDDIIDD